MDSCFFLSLTVPSLQMQVKKKKKSGKKKEEEGKNA